jgi:DNA-binding MarR family transcriptional regulator
MLQFARTVENRFRRASGSNLGLTELGVLGQIERGLDLPSQVARSLRLDPSRVTRVTDRLVGLGYVERRADPSDRRRCRLSLTEAGREQLQQGMIATSRAVESIMAGVAPSDKAALLQGLEALRAAIDVLTETGSAPVPQMVAG